MNSYKIFSVYAELQYQITLVYEPTNRQHVCSCSQVIYNVWQVQVFPSDIHKLSMGNYMSPYGGYPTNTSPAGVDSMMPAIRDHCGCIYIREWSGGILAGGFEPRGKPCFHDGIPKRFEFQLLPEDWDHSQSHGSTKASMQHLSHTYSTCKYVCSFVINCVLQSF